MSVVDFKEIQNEKGSKICSICKTKFWGFGNNPQPFYNLKVEDRCCDSCNETIVFPRRQSELQKYDWRIGKWYDPEDHDVGEKPNG